jgi:hypothetical protein
MRWRPRAPGPGGGAWRVDGVDPQSPSEWLSLVRQHEAAAHRLADDRLAAAQAYFHVGLATECALKAYIMWRERLARVVFFLEITLPGTTADADPGRRVTSGMLGRILDGIPRRPQGISY